MHHDMISLHVQLLCHILMHTWHPETPALKNWLFQLDDSKSLHETWLVLQFPSIWKTVLFRVFTYIICILHSVHINITPLPCLVKLDRSPVVSLEYGSSVVRWESTSAIPIGRVKTSLKNYTQLDYDDYPKMPINFGKKDFPFPKTNIETPWCLCSSFETYGLRLV